MRSPRVLTVTVTLLFLLLASLALGGCSAQIEPPIRLVVFLEATPDQHVNSRILERYVLPIYEQVIVSQRSVIIDIYPISDNSVSENVLLHASLSAGWRTQEEVEALSRDFRLLQDHYNNVYSSGKSYSLDVLGTTLLLDKYLGGLSGGPTEAVSVIYISDMIQRGDTSSYDFTESARGRTLEQCKMDLEGRFAAQLTYRNRFRNARVYLVKIGVNALLRDFAQEDGISLSIISPRGMEEILTFWQRDFFGSFLKVHTVGSYSGTLGALEASGLF